MSEKIIAIGGGVGPMAGVILHKKIIENTQTSGADQDHPHVLHFSCSSLITDRSEYLLGKAKENPALSMIKVIQSIKSAAKILKKEIVLGIPCITFHSPRIFEVFQDLVAQTPEICLIDLIEETLVYIQSIAPTATRIGLMSTTGARHSQVYRELLEAHGYTVLEVDEKKQDLLHDSIYNLEWGIKAVSPITDQAREIVETCARDITKAGAELIILGCTELPLAMAEKKIDGVPLVDPMQALARALIRQASPDKLKKV